MIIVSQPKNSIANFDNITNIELEEYENKGWIIKCYTTDNHHINLAIYETEERAKEVLKDIVLRYEAIELCKKASPEILGYTLADYTPVYEMPEV